MRLMHRVYIWIRRNNYGIYDIPSKKRQVNLEWLDNGNLGDELAPVIYNWILRQNGLDPLKKVKKTKHLMTIGSLFGIPGKFDSTVWGSGILKYSSLKGLFRRSIYRKFDIRCVRGPITRYSLEACGYNCPEKFGDPGVLMPLIYNTGEKCEKKYDVSLILHISQTEDDDCGLHKINIVTKDYRKFIDEICASKKVISSSLHGIILAEAYGVPAIFLCKGMNEQIIKFLDWYYSTGRMNVKMAKSIDEALDMEPMELPDLEDMRKCLIDTFPVDLWK